MNKRNTLYYEAAQLLPAARVTGVGARMHDHCLVLGCCDAIEQVVFASVDDYGRRSDETYAAKSAFADIFAPSRRNGDGDNANEYRYWYVDAPEARVLALLFMDLIVNDEEGAP
jgi:hypothetical protein